VFLNIFGDLVFFSAFKLSELFSCDSCIFISTTPKNMHLRLFLTGLSGVCIL
jgi:hypothetical protein